MKHLGFASFFVACITGCATSSTSSSTTTDAQGSGGASTTATGSGGASSSGGAGQGGAGGSGGEQAGGAGGGQAGGGAGGAQTGGSGGAGGLHAGGAGGGLGGGDGGVPASKAGCADGTREGFATMGKYPDIAACDGAWDKAGIFNMPILCNREAGNTGKNAEGLGCTVSDLCAEGWHVCHGKDDVLQRNPTGGPAIEGCKGVMDGAQSPVFFTTQMSSTGAFECASGAGATNDLFGCGDLGCDFTSDPNVKALCAPLVMSSHDLCKGLRNDLGCGDWCNHLGKYPALTNAWSCGQDGNAEALNVVKTQADQQGGVLCCRD